jgi:hypothetical protein
MSLDRAETAVVLGAVILIGIVIWYFFGDRRQS